MNEESLEQWLGDRTPPVPAPFLSHLLGHEGGLAGPWGLASLGVEELKAALRSLGRNREAAFHLLAADAFLTYTCEALAREEDPKAGLDRLLQRVGGEFP